MHTARQLGERKIIATILKHLSKAPSMAVPFGDDVSATELADGTVAVLKTDMLVGKTDVPPQMSLHQAARKAVVMNISDFASKGVRPQGLVVALGIRPDQTEEEIEQIAEGLNNGAREYDTYVLGGDTSETDDLIVSIALCGTADRNRLMLRSGAHPGDILATTGSFGTAAAGLEILTGKATASPTVREKLVNAVLVPHARLREGLALAKVGVITASTDSSDGLAWSLHEISRASNVGFLVEKPPIAAEIAEFAKANHLDPVRMVFHGGEEYELVVTIRPDGWKKAERAVKAKGGRLTRIGVVTERKSILLRQKAKTVRIDARGYEHFKQGRRAKQ